MIKREHYIKEVRPFYHSDLIKIITGIRRAGKSVILTQIIDEIKNESKNIIYLNFEDKALLNNIKNYNVLILYINENKVNKGKYFLFFDEIQNVDGWEKACKTLRLYNNSIFITPSDSKLLSKEFTKELSGRYVSFRISPFVYKEIMEYSKLVNYSISVTDYLVWGGFPKRFEFDSIETQIRYLNDLNDTIIFNDLISR